MLRSAKFEGTLNKRV